MIFIFVLCFFLGIMNAILKLIFYIVLFIIFDIIFVYICVQLPWSVLYTKTVKSKNSKKVIGLFLWLVPVFLFFLDEKYESLKFYILCSVVAWIVVCLCAIFFFFIFFLLYVIYYLMKAVERLIKSFFLIKTFADLRNINKIDFVLKSGKKISQLFNLKLIIAKGRKVLYFIKILKNKKKRNNFVKKINKKYEDFMYLQPTLDEFFLNFLTKASYQFFFHLLRSVLWAYMVARGWITTLPPMLMGGFVIPTGDGTNTNDPTEMFGKSKLPLVKYEKEVDPLPETPPKNLSKFVAVVANNTCELRESRLFGSYERQFGQFLKISELGKMFPVDWDEFMSSSRISILNTVKTGEVEGLPLPVNKKCPIDIFTASGEAWQVKTVGNLYSHDIFGIAKKYSAYNHVMSIHVAFQKLHRIEELAIIRQNTPEFYFKNMYLYRLSNMQRITPEYVDMMFEWNAKNPKYLQESHALLNRLGWVEYEKVIRVMKKIPK